MTRISIYSKDVNVTGNDRWIGSDAQNQNRTKNFTPDNVATYFNENQVIDLGVELRYFYDTLDPLQQRVYGSITFETEIGPQVNFSAISTFILSKYTMGHTDVSQFLDFLIGSNVLLSRSNNINMFGYYKIDNIEPYLPDPNFFVVTLTFDAGNGYMKEDEDYFISLVQFEQTIPEVPTKTSDLINDGEDGVHPFITAEDVTTPTLQSVTDEGNTTTNDVVVDSALYESIISNNYISTNTKGAPTGVGLLSSGVISFGNGSAYSYLSSNAANLNVYFNLPNKASGTYTLATTADIPASLLVALPFTTDHLTATNNAYIIGDVVWYLGNVYRCIANNDSILPTATAYWTNLGAGNPLVEQPTDWNSTSGNNQILNKPTIPTATSDLTNDGEDGVNPFITLADVPANGLPAGGTAGQILTKVDATDYNATWQENYADWTSQVKHIVKNNGLSGTITKGTAVYVTGSNGTNMLVGRASNASEPTSSKTMGLMQSNITTTGGTQTGFVITEGLLSGLNTAAATAGDPVWLGVNGALIYGLVNKPYAPAHLVFIGIVTKVSAGNGEIWVKVQNGFELKEIHDVDLITTTPINGHLLGFDGTLWVNKTIATWLGFTPFQLPALTSGSVLFSNGSTIAQDNANLFYNDSTNILYANMDMGTF